MILGTIDRIQYVCMACCVLLMEYAIVYRLIIYIAVVLIIAVRRRSEPR